jgi:hypothetical protein
LDKGFYPIASTYLIGINLNFWLPWKNYQIF